MIRDVGVTVALREFLPEWLVPVFTVLSLPGDLFIIVPLMGLLYLSSVIRSVREPKPNRPLCSPATASLIAIIFGGLALIVLLESLFGSPRPPDQLMSVEASKYAFPSGHSMAATIVWSGLVLWTNRWRRYVSVLSISVIVLVGISRLALGVHYLPDVLAGVVFGLLYTTIAWRQLESYPARAFTVSLVIALLAVGATAGSSRALLAFVGTFGAAFGWFIIESPPVRTRILMLVSIR